MSELAANLALGFGVAFTIQNLALAFLGCLIGTLVGVLPGLGPLATLAMLLPVTFVLEPTGALIMVAGIYYGAQYGGSTTSILVNMPGEASSVVTCLDGHQLARQGRAGAALAIAAIGSFFAGTIATLLIAILAAPLAMLGRQFGPAEYCSLMILGLVAAVTLARGSVLKALAMIVLGLALGLVGVDVNSGLPRFTFGIPQLGDGIGFVPVAMGVFGVAEIIANLARPDHSQSLTAARIGNLYPNRDEARRAAPAILRGTGVGSLLGVLPGGGALLSSFAAYMFEKKIARDPSRFGKGAIEGVAAAESANNAGAQTAFIPMLTLGIPPNPVLALMMGTMMIHSIQPGPQVMRERPALFWGLIASMWIGNVMLVIINLPLVGLWVKLLKIPYRRLFPAILLFCGVGVYSISGSTFDIFLTALFGVVGYALIKAGCEMAPMLLAFILGPLMEENFRRAMLLSRGDASVFVARPISLGLLIASATLLALVALPHLRRRREDAFQT